MAVQPFTSAARVRPGGTATYVVWVWTTRASAKHVTVDAKVARIKGLGKTRFTICPDPGGTTCTLGNLPRGQADELHVRVKVRGAAEPGRHLKLTAKAQAPGAVSFSATGKFKIVSAPASPAPTTPAPSPAPTLPPLPQIPLSDPAGSGTSPAGLFPTVSPQPSAGGSAGTASSVHKAIRATRASDTLPLNTRLIGGQLAGLVVLAAAITIAIARLSLRPQRPLDAKNSPGDD